MSAAGFCCGVIALAASGLSPALAQDALTAEGVLRIAAVGETRVVMVQGVAADPFVWEWTFLNEPAESDDGPVDMVAVSVMYDCSAHTRRPLVSEAYQDGLLVSQTPLYEVPAPITPGTLADGAWQVVCEPETNSEGATFPDLTSARQAMSLRRR